MYGIGSISFFMSIGVAVGVATLIAGSSVGNGAAQKISAQIDQMFGPGTILIGSAELKLPDLTAVAEEMEQVVPLAVPLVTDLKKGLNWSEMS